MTTDEYRKHNKTNDPTTGFKFTDLRNSDYNRYQWFKTEYLFNNNLVIFLGPELYISKLTSSTTEEMGV